MKFGKLLAAGKSWAGGNGIGRYQMRDGLHLPKFISPKNPFKQEAVAQPIAPSAVAAAPATTVVESVPKQVKPVKIQSPAVIKVVWQDCAKKLKRTAVVVAKETSELTKQAALFCLDHNPFSAIGRPKLPGIPRFGKSAVQGELTLDRVKVVRSDLMHADLEVVRAGGGSK